MTDTEKPQSQLIERPDAELAGIASDAWEAFNAMETTKRRHYRLLEILDNKRKNYNIQPSQREQSLLASLLRDHDEQVKRFTAASMQLKQMDAQAHMSLFRYIGAIGDSDEEAPVRH